MQALLLSLALLSPSQDPAVKPPAPEVVERAVKELSEAYSKTDAEAKMQAIVTNSEVLDPKVIEWIAKGLKKMAQEATDSLAGSLRKLRIRLFLSAFLGVIRHLVHDKRASSCTNSIRC